MKICIVGAGPTGTFLAYELSKEGHQVHLFEKENYIGGCWASHYDTNNNFSEHAPRVLFNNYYNTLNFWNEIGIDFKTNFRKVYSTLSRLIGYTSKFEYKDLIKLTYAYVGSLSKWESFTVYEMCQDLEISKKGKDTINDMCYVIDGVSYERMTATEFLESLDKSLLYSMYEPKYNSDKYLIKPLLYALNNNGVKIYIGHKLSKIRPGSSNGYHCTFENNAKEDITLRYDKCIICVPPTYFSDILRYSHKEIKHSWGSFNEIDANCKSSNYTGIGVQFHFENVIKPIYFNTDTVGDWKIISTFNKNSNCLSCVIVNFNLKSLYINKTVNECSINELKAEVWKQLDFYYYSKHKRQLPVYTNSTITQGITRKHNKFVIPHEAFIKNKNFNYIDFHGKNKDVFYIGPQNKNYMPYTSYESSIQSAKLFLRASDFYKRKIIIYTPLGLKFFLLCFFLILFIYFLFIRR